MITIREYYDIFRRHAPNKSDNDFVEQALLVGYTEHEVDSVVRRTVLPKSEPIKTNPVVVEPVKKVNIQAQATIQNTSQISPQNASQIALQKVPPANVERAKQLSNSLPPLVVRPSSYVNRNQIGTNKLLGPSTELKSYSYSADTVAPVSTPRPVEPVQRASIQTPPPPPIFVQAPPNLPGAMPVSQPLPMSEEPVIKTSPVKAPEVIDQLKKVAEPTWTTQTAVSTFAKQGFIPGSSINATNQPRVSPLQVAMPVVTMNRQTMTDASSIITRAPLTNTQTNSNGAVSGKGSWFKVLLILLVLIVVALAGILVYSKYSSSGLSQKVTSIISEKAPYESANVLSGILQKLVSQKNIPYVASASIGIQDKASSASFSPSAYQPNATFAKDVKRVDDLVKIKDLLAKYFAAKKKYPKTLKEAGFASLDPAQKSYVYITSPNQTSYKLTADFETASMLKNLELSVPKATYSTSTVGKVTFSQADVIDVKLVNKPFDDVWNDFLSFPSKIDNLPKKLSLSFNFGGEINRTLDSSSLDNSIAAKGLISFNGATKPVNLQAFSHSGLMSVKGSYLDKWVALDENNIASNLLGLVTETLSFLVGRNVILAGNPVSEKLVLSNQISVSAFRYDLAFKFSQFDSDISSLKDQLVKSNLIDVDSAEKLAFIAAHKDTRSLGNYINDVAKARIWVDSKGEPLKLEILATNISGRTSSQYLKMNFAIEFGQQRPEYSFTVPTELVGVVEQTNQIASSSVNVVWFSEIAKDQAFITQKSLSGNLSVAELILPIKDITDSINRLKQVESEVRSPNASARPNYATSTSSQGNVGLMPPAPSPSQSATSVTIPVKGTNLNPATELMKVKGTTTPK